MSLATFSICDPDSLAPNNLVLTFLTSFASIPLPFWEIVTFDYFVHCCAPVTHLETIHPIMLVSGRKGRLLETVESPWRGPSSNTDHFPICSMTMKAPGAERRLEEFSALVEHQRRLIEPLERSGNDIITAMNILESLLVSFFLCLHDRHRERSLPAKFLKPRAESIREKYSALLIIFPRVARRGGKIPVQTIDGIKERLDNAPVVPDFRPLTEEEQKEFMNSLSAESKKRLAELLGKKSFLESAAA
jgi:hypothetical protein